MTINGCFYRYCLSMKFLLRTILFFIAVLPLAGCIEDDFTTSPSDRPEFSVDTLDIGEVFTDELTPTFRFTVRNPHSKSLLIESVSVSGPDAGCLHINVDGISGTTFSGVEIRGKDSIFVFVEARIPEGAGLRTPCKASIDFLANGVTSSLPVRAEGINAVRLRAETLTSDSRFDSEKPYIIYDSLVVAPVVCLSLDAGTRLCFHDGASLVVRGSLLADGTPAEPVVMCGDRIGNVVADISFDIMSRQWDGVLFAPGSDGNILVNTVIKNTVSGVRAEECALTLTNCRLTNSGTLAFESLRATVDAVGCEFSEAADGLVSLEEGRARFAQCTFSNNYLFTAIGGPAIRFGQDSNETITPDAVFSNSIIYGIGSDLSHGDLSGSAVFFRNCLFKSAGTDDDNFIGCIWDADPLFHTVRNEYIFDYRLREESPAIGAGDPALNPVGAATDFYGMSRGAKPDVGAYVYVPE